MEKISCITHRKRSIFLKIHQDYLEILNRDFCAAALLAAFEYRTNNKLADLEERGIKDQEPWFEAAVPEIIVSMLGMYSERSIHAAMTLLERLGFLMVIRNKGGYMNHYLLGVEAICNALGTPTPAEANRKNDMQTEEANRKIAVCSNQQLADGTQNELTANLTADLTAKPTAELRLPNIEVDLDVEERREHHTALPYSERRTRGDELNAPAGLSPENPPDSDSRADGRDFRRIWCAKPHLKLNHRGRAFAETKFAETEISVADLETAVDRFHGWLSDDGRMQTITNHAECFLRNLHKWAYDTAMPSPCRIPILEPRQTPAPPVRPPSDPALVEDFESYMRVFIEAGKPIGECEREAAWPQFSSLNPQERANTIRDALHTCENTDAARFIPAPAKHLSRKPWTRVTQTRVLRQAGVKAMDQPGYWERLKAEARKQDQEEAEKRKQGELRA